MGEQRIGSCSICGGDVVAWVGPWMGLNPPPRPHCTLCNATARTDVVPMVPAQRYYGQPVAKDEQP